MVTHESLRLANFRFQFTAFEVKKLVNILDIFSVFCSHAKFYNTKLITRTDRFPVVLVNIYFFIIGGQDQSMIHVSKSCNHSVSS